jgi:hypothetical protein
MFVKRCMSFSSQIRNWMDDGLILCQEHFTGLLPACTSDERTWNTDDSLCNITFLQYTMFQQQSTQDQRKPLKSCSKTVHSVCMDTSSHIHALQTCGYIPRRVFPFILILILMKGYRDGNGWYWKRDDGSQRPN